LVFGLEISRGYGRTVVALSGALQRDSAEALLAAFAEIEANGDRFVDVDMGGVTAIDAQCLACIVAAQTRLMTAAAELVVIKASPVVLRLLTTTDYLDRLT